MSVEIIPAILPRSLADLTEHLERIRGISRKVQIDLVGGGFFTRNRSWPFRDRASFTALLKKEKALPYWTEFDTEIDLMVKNAKDIALTFVGFHAARVIVHTQNEGALEAAQAVSDYDEEGRPFSIGVGVALPAHSSLDELEPFLHLMDFVQVMGIDREGRQGEPFDPHAQALSLVSALRIKYPELPIQVDGGVSLKNARALARAGASRLVVGSAIFGAKDAAQALKALYTEANG